MATDQPFSKTVMFRIGLDTFLGGMISGGTVYSATRNMSASVFAGIVGAAKTLQSSLAPDPQTMNAQRQAQKAQENSP